MYGAGSDLRGAQRLRAEGAPLPEDGLAARRPRRLPPSLARRAAVSRARLLLPALAAAVAGGIAGSVAFGLILGLAVALVALPLRHFPLPLHMMPVTRIALALIPPAIACGAFALATAIGDSGLEPLDALLAGAAATGVALAIEAVAPLAFRGLPVRIATLGSPGLAHMLRCELTETGVREAVVAGWIDARGPNEIRNVVLADRIDLIALDARSLARIDGIGILATLPVRAISAEEVYAWLFGHVPPAETEQRLLDDLTDHDLGFRRTAGFRGLERLVAAGLLVVTSPALLGAALLTRLRFSAPVIEREPRLGAGGEEFSLLRLRSTSLAGLPQLLNVARGQMTFVGPLAEREETIAALERRAPGFDRRALPAPGITGWSRLRCGEASSAPDAAWRLAHELVYAPRRSAGVDVLLTMEHLLDGDEPRLRPPARLLGPEPASIVTIGEPTIGRRRRAASGESGLAA